MILYKLRRRNWNQVHAAEESKWPIIHSLGDEMNFDVYLK